MNNYHGLDTRSIAFLIILAGLALVPSLSAASPGLLFMVLVLFWTLLYTALASSWNIVGGYAGQISFGHSAFYGVGAYILTVLLIDGVSAFLALLAAGLLPVTLAILVGYPTFRLRGPFFAIATIGIGEMIRIFANNLEAVFPGGSSGLLVPSPRGWGAAEFYYLALALAILTLLTSRFIKNSKFGLALVAIRDDEDAAETLGINVTVHKMVALMISAFFVGLAGGVVALRTAYIYPDDVFSLGFSVVMILMPLIGGIGSLWGPVLGAVIFTIVDQVISVSLPFVKLLVFGGLIITILIVEPNGLIGVAKRFAAH